MRIRLGIVALAFLSLAGLAQASAIQGHDYIALNVPQHQETEGKIEVIEFFSWGCPHCYEFSPLLKRWLATLPKDTFFRRVPVSFGHPEWEVLARTYYALQSTGDLARLDSLIFDAIHRDHVSLFDEPSITTWVGKHGVNMAEFTKAFNGFGVGTSLGQAEQAIMAYRVSAIPTLAIGGRYTVTDDHAKMLATSDELIAKVRAERRVSKK